MKSLSKIFLLSEKAKSANKPFIAIHKDEERAGIYVGSFDLLRQVEFDFKE